MFRRFGTPFATDWIYKNINGYLYTAAIPAEAGLVVDTQEYNYRTNPVVPEARDADYAGRIGAYLGAVLPIYGNNFVTWWRERVVPEMERNFAYIEGLLGRLQNSANDRNWDKIRALWEMKEEVKADAELAGLFAAPTAAEIVP